MSYPADYTDPGAGRHHSAPTTSRVKAIRTRVVPPLDDELAKDLGSFESLDALRARSAADLEHEAQA